MAKFSPDKAIDDAQKALEAAEGRKAKAQKALDAKQARFDKANEVLEAGRAKVAAEQAIIDQNRAFIDRNQVEDAVDEDDDTTVYDGGVPAGQFSNGI